MFGKNEQALPWRDLLLEFAVTGSREKRALRDVLRGLQRSGELVRDHRGAYQLPGTGQVQTGLLERQGRNLTFAGLPLAPARRSWLRAGDEVAARVDGEEATVLEVIERSQEPLTGVVRARGRGLYAYDTPFLMQLVSTMHSFQITNRITRRCSMFLDLKMETIHTATLASFAANVQRGGWGSGHVTRAIRLVYDIVNNRKSMSGNNNMSWEKPQRKIRFHEGFIRDCGCGVIHELLYICTHHKLVFKSKFMMVN